MSKYEILPGLPPYGPEALAFSASGMGTHSEGFVIRFHSGSEGSWVGNFQPGLSDLYAVIPHPDSKRQVVIAGGQAYVIDPEEPSIWNHFGGQITFAQPIAELNAVLFGNDLWFELLGPDRMIWQSRRISWDEMRDMNIKDLKLSGRAWRFDETWHDFSVDLVSGAVQGGSYDGPGSPGFAIEFETPRLAFKVWQDRHRAPFAAMNADPEVMRYFPALQSEDESNARIDFWKTQFAENGWSNWAVELRTTGEFIGFIGLSIPRVQLPFISCVEIGWRLKRSAWGHGYATEGGKACLRVAFDHLSLAEVVSFTSLLNTRSIAVMQRIGMTNANANFEHPLVAEGHPLRPHCLYKITLDAWRSKRAAS
jgi:RimJ/RimL family protein N-acetyltransferase